MTRADIFAAIDRERDRQSELWNGSHRWGSGDCSGTGITPEVKATVLAEECGEVARAVLDHEPVYLRKELVQVAAVAVAWLESF
jgi:hypothetical protein